MKLILGLVLGVLTLAASTLAWAQPGSLIIDRNRPDRNPPAQQPRGPHAHAKPQNLVTTKVHAFAPFVLRQVQVQGASAPTGLIGAASRPFIGRTLDAQEVARVADAVAAAYAKTDIALYTIVVPDQDFADGIVSLAVTEGYISDVVIQGDTAHQDLSLLRAYGERLTAQRPLRRSALDHVLQLIKAIPGLKVETGLLQGSRPGAVRLLLTIRQKKAQFGLSVNNRGTELLGRTQVELDAVFNSTLREGDQTQLTYAAPTDFERFHYYALSNMQPIGADGTTVQVNAGYLTTRPKGTGISGHAMLVGLQISHPLILQSDRSLYVTGSIDGLNSDNALFGELFSDDRTRAARGALAFTRTGADRTIAVSMTGSLGLDALGAKQSDPRLSRLNFRKLNLQASIEQGLGRAWIVRLKTEAQLSPDRLPASEQLALGGEDFGRAFPSAVAIGDMGAAGAAELAWRSPGTLVVLPKGSELYGFVDAGRVREVSRSILPGQTSDLSSFGIGARLAVGSKAVVQFEGAQTLLAPAIYGGRQDSRFIVGWKSVY